MRSAADSRRMRPRRKIPVIFVTALGEVEDEIKGFELGAVDYITKPISPPRVLARVGAHLALREARRSWQPRTPA